MELKLNQQKSTSLERYYQCDASTLNTFFSCNDLFAQKGVRDCPNARKYFSDEFGIDMRPYQEVMQPYAHCDKLKNIFTQLEETRTAEQARVRLTFTPYILKDDGIFYYLTPDYFPANKDLDYHIKLTGELVFNGKLADGTYQFGVLGSRNRDNTGRININEVRRQTVAWSEVFTDLRYLTTDKRIPPVSYIYSDGDFYHRDMTGEFLSFNLNKELDLPWLVNNSRSILEELADDTNFQHLVKMKRVILDAKDMRSASKQKDDPIRPLSILEQSANSYSNLFEENLFDPFVLGKTAGVETAVKSLYYALEAQLQAAEYEYNHKAGLFSRNDDGRLIKFLLEI